MTTAREQLWRAREKSLLAAAPALLALLLALLVYGIWRWTCTPESLTERFNQEAAASLSAQSGPRARVAALRVLQMRPHDSAARFTAALAMRAAGEERDAELTMIRLAPRDQTGYVPAHLWRARQLLSIDRPTQPMLVEAEGHLVRVLSVAPGTAEARQLLTRLLLRFGRLDEAVPHLQVLANASPIARVELAQLLSARGEIAQSKEHAQQAANELAARLRTRPDEADTRMFLAEAHALNRDFEAAQQALREGMTLNPKGPWMDALAKLYLRWLESASRESKDSGAQVRGILTEGARLIEAAGVENPESRALLARVYVAINRPEDAVKHLTQASDGRPELKVELARILYLLKRDAEATRAAREALSQLQTQLESAPGNHLARFLAADAALLARDPQSAVKVLNEGREKHPAPGYDSALERAYIAWWDSTRGDVAAGPRLDLLREATRYNPASMQVVQRLLVFRGDDAAEADARDLRRDILRRSLALGRANVTAHLLLGTDAMEAGDIKTGRSHLEQAYQLDPRTPEILNNLAWTLAESDPPELQRALALVDEALKERPDAIAIRDTRGRILVKLGRWPEAVAELEKCLPTMRGKPDFHRALAQAYEKIGLPDLAAEHEKQAGSAAAK